MSSLAKVVGSDLTLHLLDIVATPKGIPRYQSLLDGLSSHEIVFDSDPQRFAKPSNSDKHTYLPHYLGDGQQATFHLTR
jgi:hypothetical protein